MPNFEVKASGADSRRYMQVDPDSQKLKEEDHRNQIAHHPSALSSILILGSIPCRSQVGSVPN
jgi:hypothetical protein